MERNNKKLGPSLWKLSVMPLGPHTQKKRDATWRGFFMPAYTLEMKNVEVMGIQRLTLNKLMEKKSWIKSYIIY